MSRAANFDVSRLPSYRSSCIERFHPYARVSARRPQDTLMTTVDYRYREGARSAARCEEAHNDVSAYEEDPPAAGVDVDREVPAESPEERLGRSKLAGTLTELLDALRNTYLTLQAVRAFLAPGQTK
ncbi:hypothetical protein LXA43DRAFT_1090481 [Ganoderma leucocontextum]|nr:hypothetical protein LXA43DRAFT_1090481 [Ganoderma leucocontextum]